MNRSALVAVATTAFLQCTTLPGQEWYREDRSAPPPARRFLGLGFDPERAVTVLFGGTDERTGTVYGDTWEFDGRDWRQRATSGPAARQRFASCFDRARGTFVVFGGLDANGAVLGDAWEWDGNAWKPLVAANAPAARADAAMAFDEVRGKLVLFGGRAADPSQRFGDTWEFDGTNWAQVAPAGAPAPRFGHAMTFDPVRAVTLLFGGFAGGSGPEAGTYAYDGTTWRDLAPATTPPASVFPALTFHRAHGVAVLTGSVGSASQPLRTFAFDGVDWQDGPPAHAQLTGRQGHAMAFDEVREAVVLFGGASIAIGGARPLDDTWELSVPAEFQGISVGCATSKGVLRLSAADGSRPELGGALGLTVGPVPPQSSPFLLLGSSERSWADVALPIDLAPIGMPGCWLYTSVEFVAPMIPQGETAHALLPIPLDRGLLDKALYAQVALLGQESATSNGGRLRIGN